MPADEKEGFFAEHPELLEKVAELSLVRDVLHESGTEERETVANSRAGTTERDRRAVAEALRARAGSAPVATEPMRGRPGSPS